VTPILGLFHHDTLAPLVEAHPDAVEFLALPAERMFAPESCEPPHPGTLLADRFRVAVHGNHLALTGAAAFDTRRARHLARLADHHVFEWVAERLDAPPAPDGVGDLFERVVERVERLQDFLGMSVLISNGTDFSGDPAVGRTSLAFLGALAARTGCGLLPDLDAFIDLSESDAATLLDDLDALDGDAVRAICLSGLAAPLASAAAPVPTEGSDVAHTPAALMLRLVGRCRRLRGVTVRISDAAVGTRGIEGLVHGLAEMRAALAGVALEGHARVVAFPGLTNEQAASTPPRPRGYLPGQGRGAPVRLVHCTPEPETPPAVGAGDGPGIPGT
jgi:uncharacterized protein (UPF0276 family)